MAGFGRRTALGTSSVCINIYDLNESNEYFHPIGLGFYHSGIKIGSSEYTFGSGSGIFEHEPGQAPGARLRETVDLGGSPSRRDIAEAIQELRNDFKGSDYNILTRNCNHFAGIDQNI